MKLSEVVCGVEYALDCERHREPPAWRLDPARLWRARAVNLIRPSEGGPRQVLVEFTALVTPPAWDARPNRFSSIRLRQRELVDAIHLVMPWDDLLSLHEGAQARARAQALACERAQEQIAALTTRWAGRADRLRVSGYARTREAHLDPDCQMEMTVPADALRALADALAGSDVHAEVRVTLSPAQLDVLASALER